MREAGVRRALRVLLWLYPADFRADMGTDLVETAVHRRRDAQRQWPRTGSLRFWLTEGVRCAVDGLLERVRSLRSVSCDVAHAWRQLRRVPGHHAVAVATLALGVGAATTIFTVADAVVFRPLPYADGDALYLVHARFGSLELSSNSLLNLQDLQASVKTMSWLAAASDRSPALTDAGREAERIAALDVTAEYLPNLGGRVSIGRPFTVSDFGAGAERVVILSEALWRRRWGGDPGVLGRTVQLDGRDHVIVGVMHHRFRDPEPIESGAVTDVWVPTRAGGGAYANRDDYGYRVLGRLSDESSLAAARAELSAAGERLSAAYPDANRMGEEGLDFLLHPLREATLGEARPRLLLLLGAVVLLLLLACANVANLFLARGLTRSSELAVRSALGATRARLGMQLFSESLLTASLAGVVGALVAYGGVRAFVAAAPPGIPRLHEVSVDPKTLMFVLVLIVVTAVVFGSVPALRGSRAALASVSGTRMTAARSAQRLQSALVALGVAISLVLVTGSALLLNSFRHMLRVDPGFGSGDVLVVDVRPPVSARTYAEEFAFYQALVERASAAPGVERAALVHAVPGMTGGAWARVTIDDEAAAQPATERGRAPAVGSVPGEEFFRFNTIYGPAFDALDMPVLAGRAFDGHPGQADPLVVIVNEAAARRFFPHAAVPLGRRIMLGAPGSEAPLREIIGIVGDVRQRGPAHPAEPQIYVPYGQRDINRLSLVLEVEQGAVLPVETVRGIVRDAAPDVPLDRIETLSARYAATGQQARFLTYLLSVFAAVGLLLAVVGTYATASHALSRRLRELGVRIALGARAGAVFRLVLGHALRVALAGIAVGLLLTLVLARFLAGYVYGITARDPLTLAGAALLIGACAALASLGPAIRAARVDPQEVLRSD